MNILIIGGTRFVGRHLVEAALARGHEITLFNRGKSNPKIFPQVESIQGDRERNLSKLSNRNWDTVIDTCGYFPRIVGLSAESLKDSVRQYVFISSVSAYADFDSASINEDYPLGRIEDDTIEEVTEKSYGPLKVLCEKAVQAAFPENSLIIRPGLIVGPYDPTDRFTYWPLRVDRGGDILAPVGPDEPVQFIHARDLADFTIKHIEEKTSGIFNAVGPEKPHQIGNLLETCKEVSNSEANFVWAPEEFIKKQKIEPWSEIPLWIPESEGGGFSQISNARARSAGLTFKRTEIVVRETLTWAITRPTDYKMRAGLDPAREAELLKKLNS